MRPKISTNRAAISASPTWISVPRRVIVFPRSLRPGGAASIGRPPGSVALERALAVPVDELTDRTVRGRACLVGGSLETHAPVVEKGESLPHGERAGHVVRDHQRGHAQFVVEPPDHTVDRVAGDRVEEIG